MPSARKDTAARVPGFIEAVVARIKAGLSRSAVNRRVLRRLSHVSDSELAQSGLVRGDVIEASAPRIQDPMSLLLDRRATRRGRDRSRR